MAWTASLQARVLFLISRQPLFNNQAKRSLDTVNPNVYCRFCYWNIWVHMLEYICWCQTKWRGLFEIKVHPSSVNVKMRAFPWICVLVEGGLEVFVYSCEPSGPGAKLGPQGTGGEWWAVAPSLCAPSAWEITAESGNSNFMGNFGTKVIKLVPFLF